MEKVQRFSKKRQAIYDALRSTREHPSAEWVYQTLKPEYPDLSLGTVYRNIKGMVEVGDVICVGNVEGKDRFDAYVHPHAHLLCSSCGTVVDLDITEDMAAQCRAMAEANDIDLDLRSLQFAGRCSGCRNQAAFGTRKH